jgi:hypothetical protein
MRRLLMLLMYLGMVAVGAYLLIGLLTYGGRLFIVLVGAFLLIFGMYLLWIDFLAPADAKLTSWLNKRQKPEASGAGAPAPPTASRDIATALKDGTTNKQQVLNQAREALKRNPAAKKIIQDRLKAGGIDPRLLDMPDQEM